MTALQTEFPMSVAVCAWCKPQKRGSVLGVISHGICLRHLKRLKLTASGKLPERRGRTVRSESPRLDAFLFPV
jgi:hypothetical protein